jgi:hypothetical protein
MKTFIVRLFVPAELAPVTRPDRLHGIVQEIGSDSSMSFAGGEELLACLSRRLSVVEARPPERSTP